MFSRALFLRGLPVALEQRRFVECVVDFAELSVLFLCACVGIDVCFSLAKLYFVARFLKLFDY